MFFRPVQEVEVWHAPLGHVATVCRFKSRKFWELGEANDFW
jgi:hypothetical protein